MIWTPHQYQLEGVKFLLQRGSAALFLDPGLGKTSITLKAITTLKQTDMVRRTLIIAPLRVCYSVWGQEIEKWGFPLTISILHGPEKQKKIYDNTDIHIINPEGLEWLISTGRLPSYDLLVFDELSKFKHTNTKRFKSLKPHLGLFARKWGLTGSPAANGLMDLFGQIYVLDQGRTFGPYITHYRNKYFIPDYMGYTWEIKPGAAEEIYERIEPIALRIGADDNIDLPELVENRIVVDLPPDAMRAYRLMEDALVTEVNARRVTAANAAAAAMKCRQLASGGVYHDPTVGQSRGHEIVHTAKIEALKDLLEELQGTPVLVAYAFEHELARIKDAIGRDTPHIGGGVSPRRGKELAEKWNRGEIPALLVHPDTISHGVNLQESGNHVCWFSNTWNFEHHDQLIRRVWRQGQKAERVFVHHIVARGTVDEVILAVLHNKERTQGALFDALKKMGGSPRKLGEGTGMESAPISCGTSGE